MNKATNHQVLSALEQAIIGLSSGLQDLPHGSDSYNELKAKIDELFEQWRDLDKKLNPCNIRIND